MVNRIIYYYQTFVGLRPILDQNPIKVTHIHLSSFHFGLDSNNEPYIHLNDFPPDNEQFKTVWEEIKEARQKGIKVLFMIGGAGGAYGALFSNFEVYYNLLIKTIKQFPYIDGIDLDIEEDVDIKNVIMMIERLKQNFGNDFIISMAPLAGSLMMNNPGMGGFIYKTLYNVLGKSITYFNGQFYGDFSLNSYDIIMENGYPQEKVVMGMLSGDIDMKDACSIISNVKKKYPNFGGVFVWEYCNAPPDPNHHEKWSEQIYNAINPSYFSSIMSYFGY